MAIAQMNWGRLKYPVDHPLLSKFLGELEEVYGLAEQSPGFIWRLDEETLQEQLVVSGWDIRSSVTVSVWETEADLRRFTFDTVHGKYLDKRLEWYEVVEGPQLVMWTVDRNEKPDFLTALNRLEYLKNNDSTEYTFGWH